MAKEDTFGESDGARVNDETKHVGSERGSPEEFALPVPANPAISLSIRPPAFPVFVLGDSKEAKRARAVPSEDVAGADAKETIPGVKDATRLRTPSRNIALVPLVAAVMTEKSSSAVPSKAGDAPMALEVSLFKCKGVDSMAPSLVDLAIT